MRISQIAALKLVCLIGFLCAVSSCASVESAVEAGGKSPVQKQAPAECLFVFREFFAYVRKPGPGIVKDEQAQKRWLSEGLRKGFAGYVKRSGSPADNPDYPSNSTFVGVWNNPTTHAVVGSRHYDYRDRDNPDDHRAVVDVLYEWDKAGGADNQYPGEKSLRSFIFVHERGAWKLDDVYTFTDEYTRAGSLRSHLEKE